MNLRFEVNRAEALRHGLDIPKSTVTIQVRASNLTPEQKRLIADRLDGIDVVKLHYDPRTHVPQKTYYLNSTRRNAPKREPVRIQANLPTFDAMMEAIEANQAEVAQKRGYQQTSLKTADRLTRALVASKAGRPRSGARAQGHVS
jgi:hypothetical protein